MNLHWPFFHRPDPAPVRYIVATRQESRKARTARVHTELQLAIAVNRLTPEQKREAIARASYRSSQSPDGKEA
jgi:hypothetical protein